MPCSMFGVSSDVTIFRSFMIVGFAPHVLNFCVDAVFSNSMLAYKIETHEDYYISFIYFLYDGIVTMMQRIQ